MGKFKKFVSSEWLLSITELQFISAAAGYERKSKDETKVVFLLGFTVRITKVEDVL